MYVHCTTRKTCFTKPTSYIKAFLHIFLQKNIHSVLNIHADFHCNRQVHQKIFETFVKAKVSFENKEIR